MKDPTVIQAKRFGVVVCECQTPLIEAARLMAEEDISALVVVDDGKHISGIITRMDLLKAKKDCLDWHAEAVEDWMSRQVVTVSPRDHLSHVADLLLKQGIHRVVAVQEDKGRLIPLAVISAADLVYHMAKEE